MRMRLCSTLVLTLTLLWLPVQAAPQNQDTSQTEKAKKCDETAKKRGLKGDEKATFVSSCMAAKDTASATMSPEEKAKVDNAQSCEQQATQKGLKRPQVVYEDLQRGRPQVVPYQEKASGLPAKASS